MLVRGTKITALVGAGRGVKSLLTQRLLRSPGAIICHTLETHKTKKRFRNPGPRGNGQTMLTQPYLSVRYVCDDSFV